MANIVEDKISEISKQTAEKYSGNEDEIRSIIRSIIIEDGVQTTNAEISEIANSIRTSDADAKTIRLAVGKWKENNAKEVIDYKKAEFDKDFESELRNNNPNLTEYQIKKAKEYGELIDDVFLEKTSIDDQKDKALIENKESFKEKEGLLPERWTDLQGITSLLNKEPEEVKHIRDEYNSLRNELGSVNLPSNRRQERSFDRIFSSFNNPEIESLFSQTKNYVSGWVNKGVTKIGQQFISKIGNQAVSEFASNALSFMSNGGGFQNGFAGLMKGIMSGGVRAGATAAASGAATGVAAGAAAGAVAAGEVVATGAVAAGAGAATMGIGAIIVVAGAAIKKIKEIGDKIADKLGIGFDKELEGTLGKGGAKTVKITIAIVVPILFIFMFVFTLFQGSNFASSEVPPKGETADVGAGDSNPLGGVVGKITIPSISGNFTRQDLIDVAMSLKGKVHYDLGGDYNCLGACSNWGQLKPIGLGRPQDIYYGIDCSGLVNWVYKQLTGKIIAGTSWDIIAKGNSGEWQFVNESDLKAGDVAWRTGHVALCIGKDSAGNNLFIEAYNGINLRSDTATEDGNKPMSFMKFLRPNVTFSGD
jgi:hypothetical protein